MLRKLLMGVLLGWTFSGHAAGFVLEDMQGKVHRLEDYRGKWVLVNYWATWCPPCLNEIPELISLHGTGKVTVIGIAISSGTRKNIAKFVKARGMNYPVVIGNDKIIAQIGKADLLPTSYLYAPNGEQVSYQTGEVTRATIETYIKNKKLD